GVAVEGAVALISRGTCPFADKALYAAQAGAAAVILYNNADGALNPTLGAESDEWVPTVGITQAAGQAILDAIAGGADAVATYDLQTHVEEFETDRKSVVEGQSVAQGGGGVSGTRDE